MDVIFHALVGGRATKVIIMASNTRLRVFAERAVRSFDDHKHAHPALGDFEQVLPTTAAAYIAAYDAQLSFERTRVLQLAEGREKLRALDKLIRTWSGILSVTVPAFDPSEFRGSYRKPDDLLQDAKRLLDMLEPERARLPSADELMTTLSAARTAAHGEWTFAQRALAKHRELQHEVGKQVARMAQVLTAFRTTLEEVLGVDHRDCQMLRSPRRAHRSEPQPIDENRELPVAAE